MSTDLQSAVERLTVLCKHPTAPAVGLSVVDCADLRLVLDALAAVERERDEERRMRTTMETRHGEVVAQLAAAVRERDELAEHAAKAERGSWETGRKYQEVLAQLAAARKDSERWAFHVQALIDDLPERRDWLNPDTERELRELVIEYGMSLAARQTERTP